MSGHKDKLIDDEWFFQELEAKAREADWESQLPPVFRMMRKKNPNASLESFLALRERMIRNIRRLQPSVSEERAGAAFDKVLKDNLGL